MRSAYALSLLGLLASASAANIPIPKTGWTYTADSEQTGNEIAKAFDSDPKTFWASKTGTAFPHKVTIDLKKVYVVNGFEYVPRQDGNTAGFVGRHTIEVSKDNKTWVRVAHGTQSVEAKKSKTTRFTDVAAQYVRYTAQTDVNGGTSVLSTAAELNVLSPDIKLDGTKFSPLPASKGKWEVTINFPVVPTAVGLLTTDKLLAWSAFKTDDFNAGTGLTQMASWDVTKDLVTARTVAETGHDMFCPGLTMDPKGRLIITGGNDNKKTTIFTSADEKFSPFADMKMGRGYQTSTLLSDGRVFTIGGSWSDPRSGKNGEIYDIKTNTWTMLNKALVAPMLTDDHEGVYRSDNHGWLFGWKYGSVFQAGPSKAMNWYRTHGDGEVFGAGNRGNAHSMNGIAVMYDALAGKIFTAGGATDYENATAQATANIISLGENIEDPVKVETLSTGMSYARALHNAVLLPNGQIVLIGGQSVSRPFFDTGAIMTPELWDPITKKFTSLNPIATPRTYHSSALLLRDGSVFSGGGGLCGECEAGNHMDGQILLPPYLFNADGSRATRPVFKTITQRTLPTGFHFNVQYDSAVTAFSLVRYGSATHSVNTDQRRIPLEFEKLNDGPNMYRMMTPYSQGQLLAGPWMLFAMNAQGTPSVGELIWIEQGTVNNF